jgi:uncharacterized protein YaaQ
MKLVMAIVHDEDGNYVLSALNHAGFGVTKLCSTGGFLKAGNTTLIAGVEEENIEEVIRIIKENSNRRNITVDPSFVQTGFAMDSIPIPHEVSVGGATIFVLNVERFEKS